MSELKEEHFYNHKNKTVLRKMRTVLFYKKILIIIVTTMSVIVLFDRLA